MSKFKRNENGLISTARQLRLSHWFKTKTSTVEFKNFTQYSEQLKLNKFLFFYELTSKIEGDEYDFTGLMGFKQGPVYGNVYSDIAHNLAKFNQAIEFNVDGNIVVNEGIANFCKFLVDVLTTDELSKFTHDFDIWKAQKEAIQTTSHLKLDEDHISDADIETIKYLREVYTEDYIESVRIIKFYKRNFVISKVDYSKWIKNYKHLYHQLDSLSWNPDLVSPVYIQITDEGELLHE